MKVALYVLSYAEYCGMVLWNGTLFPSQFGNAASHNWSTSLIALRCFTKSCYFHWLPMCADVGDKNKSMRAWTLRNMWSMDEAIAPSELLYKGQASVVFGNYCRVLYMPHAPAHAPMSELRLLVAMDTIILKPYSAWMF